MTAAAAAVVVVVAADRVEQSGAPELVGDRDRVGRFTLAVERFDRLEDVAVRGLVEVVGPARLEGGRDRVARQQHRTEQRLLGLQVVRRDPAGPAWSAAPAVVELSERHRRRSNPR